MMAGDRDAAGRFAPRTPAEKLRAQIEGRAPKPAEPTVRVENIASHAARIEERLGIRREKPAPKQPKSFAEVLEEAISRNAARTVTVTEKPPRRKGGQR